MKKQTLFVAFFLISNTSLAGELVKEATVSKLGNTSNGSPDFYVRVTGGSGVCANSLIKFPESKKASDDSNHQAMSIALTALAIGKKVRIVNFEDDHCHGANFIEISQ